MTVARSIRPLSRRDPALRAVALAWRELTGGTQRSGGFGKTGCRRTLIACSGGGDSSGLVLALASAIPDAPSLFTVAHIVHDLRPRDQALPDRDAARALAESLGLPFAEAEISIRSTPGNPEAVARRLRYAALGRLAAQHRCPFIATAHHAEDQLETLLMGLLRGSGPRGLRGVAPKRRLAAPQRDHPAPAPWLIRPALSLRRADLRRLCDAAGWTWREDATNADTSRLRSAVRHRILPLLEDLRPGVALRASRSASLIADASRLIDARIADLLARADRSTADCLTWPRSTLRRQRPAILGGLLQSAAATLHAGSGRDRITGRIIAPAVGAIRDSGTDPRRFSWRGIQLEVTSRSVRITRSHHGR